MKTITIDNKHYISARVVMLFTNKSNDNAQIALDIETNNLLCAEEYLVTHFNSNDRFKTQHLYLVCDLPIEEGDWIYQPNTGIVKVLEIEKLRDYSNYRFETSDEKNWICDLTNDCKKVITATDRLVIYVTYHSDDDIILPQFPQSFIKEFVERQGKDVDVLVEVDLLIAHDKQGNRLIEPDIKLNQDNTVNLIFK